ncbi:MAG: restriction endonuclease subunit S [Patescibacteria group bacterium]|jgi:type I restriction enzyme S subunit
MNTNLVQKNIPKGWEIKKIKDLLDYERPDKYIVESSSYTDKGKIPVLTANKSFILGYTEEDFGIYGNLPVIIFDDFTTDSKLVDFPFKIKSSAIKILRSKSEHQNLRYLFELIKSINFLVGDHKRYYISEFQNLDVVVPPWEEQKKIVEILMSVDDEIKKTDEIISQTGKLKKGLMQDLFTKGIGHKKFKKTKIGEIPEEWKVATFEEFATLQRGFDLPASDRISGEYPLVTSNGITSTHNKSKVKAPGVVTGRSGTLGNVFYIKDDFWPLNTTLYVKNFYGNNERFVYYKIKSFDLIRFGTGTGVPTLNRNIVHKEHVAIPNRTEQNKIADILFNIDYKITNNIKFKEKLVELKKGLIQDLLSGKVRVKICG